MRDEAEHMRTAPRSRDPAIETAAGRGVFAASRGECFENRHKSFWPLVVVWPLLLLLAGCQTVPRFPAVDLKEPGWTVRQGQAIWKRQRNGAGIVGEILLATRPDGRAYVEFSKNPFPLVIAQSTRTTWEAELPAQNRRYSGRGLPPSRLIFLYVPRALGGMTLPRKWAWQKTEDNGWRLENRSNGESLEIYFSQ